MATLSRQNIEAELSYAYLHAVAAKAGMSSKIGSRHDDNSGVDATITAVGPFEGGGLLTEVDVNIQLKATTKAPADDGTGLSYFLQDRGMKRYDALRSETHATPRVLVVLFLPQNECDWLAQTEEELAVRQCAYWVSLRGAHAVENTTGVTVKLPRDQVLSPSALLELVIRLSRRDFPKIREGTL